MKPVLESTANRPVQDAEGLRARSTALTAGCARAWVSILMSMWHIRQLCVPEDVSGMVAIRNGNL